MIEMEEWTLLIYASKQPCWIYIEFYICNILAELFMHVQKYLYFVTEYWQTPKILNLNVTLSFSI